MDETIEVTFHIVTPYKGPMNWLSECMESVRNQLYPTSKKIHHVIIDNDNKGPTRNHFETLQKISPVSSNIVVHLDGDDYFDTNMALSIIAQEYKDSNVWATYGNYVSKNKSVCRPIDSRGFRESIVDGGWPWSHPRTFRAHLIPYLKEDWMKDKKGKWYSSAGDVAIFCPVLELCGKDRVKFIDKKLVYYRIHENNESSFGKIQDQVRCALELYERPILGKL